jgi:hypothetical protein
VAGKFTSTLQQGIQYSIGYSFPPFKGDARTPSEGSAKYPQTELFFSLAPFYYASRTWQEISNTSSMHILSFSCDIDRS